MYNCQHCGKEFNFPDGILAEIKDNRVVVESCSPFTELSELCMECVKELNITLA